MRGTTFPLILLSVAMISLGQLLFKVVGLRLGAGIPWREPSVLAIFGAACGIYASATVIWIWILRTMPLTKAYPFMALSFVLVPLGSVLLLSERVDTKYCLGTLLIMAGVVLIGHR